MPTSRIEAARRASASSSKWVRGCFGFGAIELTGTSRKPPVAASPASGAPGISADNPRPRPPRFDITRLPYGTAANGASGRRPRRATSPRSTARFGLDLPPGCRDLTGPAWRPLTDRRSRRSPRRVVRAAALASRRLDRPDARGIGLRLPDLVVACRGLGRRAVRRRLCLGSRLRRPPRVLGSRLRLEPWREAAAPARARALRRLGSCGFAARARASASSAPRDRGRSASSSGSSSDRRDGRDSSSIAAGTTTSGRSSKVAIGASGGGRSATSRARSR